MGKYNKKQPEEDHYRVDPNNRELRHGRKVLSFPLGRGNLSMNWNRSAKKEKKMNGNGGSIKLGNAKLKCRSLGQELSRE